MRKMFTKVLIAFLSFLLFTGCRDEVKEYYERPDYLRGNAYEFLQERGNFTYFLSALEMTGYKDALDGRGLYSVFAPNDESFQRYMTKKGKTSLQDFNLDSLKILISYHLIEFSFNRSDFLAFSKTASAEEPEEGDGSCYKYETLAQEGIKTMTDPNTVRNVKVYQQKKFLPVLSTRLFRTQESNNYESDYKVFFPSINWQGDDNHLYVANAAVVESGIPIDNGYMYVVDEVIEPLPTVYNALAGQSSNFKIFKELYDRFAYMYYDANKTKDYAELGDSLFQFYHYLPPTAGEDLPDIACEWTVSENESDYEARLKYAFNCFVPTDNVLAPYIQNFFGVEHYQDIPLLNLYYLLKAHVANRQKLILPSQLDKGLEGSLGEEWTVERNNLVATQFCSNGVLYGIDKVLEPAVFTMVMRPFFQYPRFSTMLNIAHKQGTFGAMVDPEREYTIFAIANDALKDKYGYNVNYYANEDIDVLNGRVTIETFNNEEDHTIRTMSGDEQSAFIQNQVVDGYIKPQETMGKRVFYPTRESYHFIYTENGQIYGENRSSISPLETWEFTYPNGDGRGIVYEVGDKFQSNKENVGMALFSNADKYQKFYQALLEANLIQLKPDGVTNIADVTAVEMDWLKGERCMVFAPLNNAWDETKVPTDSVELDRFLKFFFVPMVENKLQDYILPNHGTTGTYETRCAYTPATKAKMRITFSNDKQLNIANEDNLTVQTDGEVPFFATDGLIYGIKELLTPVKP